MGKTICLREKMVIPTYPEAAYEELPMFAENRVHQRSSGNPYPNKVIIKTHEKEKVDKEYDIIRLENDFIELLIMPEIGGRIFSAKDKKNDYYFFYRQHVIKPALIGALGSWISGGIEFNWPYHHRPSTYMPVDVEITEDKEGITVWCSEHDPVNRMKGMVGIRLEHDKCYFETRMKVSNRTPVRHSFLWWENTAVPVNPQYEIFFPPDVDHVKFHHRRSATTFPMAKGIFNGYNFDDENGTDISKHFNTKFSTSFFSADSKYDFFGGYDNGLKSGVVHVADHNTAPGKKMFTWAYNQLSRSWEKALTDTDGAYAELMAGSYSNNQPDFAWLEPYETKNFSQFWYPIREIGVPTFATLECALTVKSGKVTIMAQQKIKSEKLILEVGGKKLISKTVSLMPGEIATYECASFDESAFTVTLGNFLSYTKAPKAPAVLPPLNQGIETPSEIESADYCYRSGLHYYQYRDPIADPLAYFLRAIELDPKFVPAYSAAAEMYFNRHDLENAFKYAKMAVDQNSVNTKNHETGRHWYMLGLVQQAMGADEDAIYSFRRAAWNEDSVSSSLARAAMLYSKQGNYRDAIFVAKNAIDHNRENYLAESLLALAYAKTGEKGDAKKILNAILDRDPVNHYARFALTIIGKMSAKELFSKLSSNPSQTMMDIGFDFIASGYEKEVKKILSALPDYTKDIAPTLAFYLGKPELANKKHRVFPFRLEEREILKANTNNEYARYLLGCMHFNCKKRDAAEVLWQSCGGYEAARNLAVCAYLVGDTDGALSYLNRAIELSPDSEQLGYEKAYILNHVEKNAEDCEKQIAALIPDLTDVRDDLATEWANAANRAGHYDEAIRILSEHDYIPCEGGETAIARQHINAYIGKAREAMANNEYSRALDYARTAQVLPDNLGAGLWHMATISPAQFIEAKCLIRLDRRDDAEKVLAKILYHHVDFFSNNNIPQLPVYQGLSLILLGKSDEGKKQIESFIRDCEAKMNLKDSGFFASTPFFISYLDKPEDARRKYFSDLIAFAKASLSGENGLL